MRKSLKFTTLSEWICFETRWLAPVFRASALRAQHTLAQGGSPRLWRKLRPRNSCGRGCPIPGMARREQRRRRASQASPLVALLLAAGRYCREPPLEEMAQRERAIYCQRVPPPPCSATEFRNHGPDGCSGAAKGALLIPHPSQVAAAASCKDPSFFIRALLFLDRENAHSHWCLQCETLRA